MTPAPKQRPAYAISSVDHALRLAALLQLEGRLTVAAAAEHLGVAPSTAHRLLQMLVYRDFALRDETSRSYLVGPVMLAPLSSPTVVSRLRDAAMPHLRRVTELLGESTNLIVRSGTSARFAASVEADRDLRVSSREGMAFPAHRTSGGLVLLAELRDEEVADLYDQEPREDRPDLDGLRRELERVRAAGFAVNRGRAEDGIIAVGVPVQDEAGSALAALCVSLPTVRHDRGRLPQVVAVLHQAAAACARDLS